ncbi:hypothetical protein [Gluconacetobacter takamatsuzukensis]|uniref:Uncharacterized protein n=1 Tax=Gluconacetobacter takamatsuzukensis TaxID=1286190 RepID=A0A7W4PQ55_9PROT|nr:hypothetical protein [Gluconacetobacter takamatsuzukensis]MBB2206170.1 hypothetical protein [Gluconacetobacter takamatsuzukensis]
MPVESIAILNAAPARAAALRPVWGAGGILRPFLPLHAGHPAGTAGRLLLHSHRTRF